jgi:N-methylhydantoinase A/oxoprolinase/acetone carboxylase beta subunit
MRIGIDSGGTFTDFVVLDDEGHLDSFKLRSDPASPASVVLEGLRRIATKRADVVHGSTVATNALLERKGARTAFVTTKGFEDLIAIGRQNRPELYNLTSATPIPLVPRELCFGVDERILFDGSIERPMPFAEIECLRRKLEQSRAESVAICLLHSYQNDTHERMLLAILTGFVSASCDISPEFREFERASTTVINAYVAPLMDRYLGDLERRSPHRVAIMQSNGGVITAAEARKQAVRTILSGPAGGIVGAVEIARLAGFRKALTFDMGGTSTDVALASQQARLTTEARIDNYPVRLPMLDIHTVGAGGGSIAYVDSGGSLRVGPQSAGAVPGPACYAVGNDATVTDAHVVLGRISPNQLAGGQLQIDPKAGEAAVARIGAALGLDAVRTAAAILRVANSNMERAIRAVSVERGEDPREFPLIAFGGCGGLHACEIAEELRVETVIVPRLAGALSALGMLLADRTRDYSIGALGVSDHEKRFNRLERQAKKDLPRATLERFADVRYVGQSYELTIAWNSDFHAAHQRAYGYSDPGRPTETVTLRVRATVCVEKPSLRAPTPRKQSLESRRIWLAGRWRNVTTAPREALGTRPISGPALIADYGSTALVPAGWSMQQDRAGSLTLRRDPRANS